MQQNAYKKSALNTTANVANYFLCNQFQENFRENDFTEKMAAFATRKVHSRLYAIAYSPPYSSFNFFSLLMRAKIP